MGEKFAANPVTGTGSMTVPIATSPGRGGFGPQLALSYDSGAGNGPFGLGWNLPLPAITRKTDRGLTKYQEAEESDVFILSGAEDLVPVLVKVGKNWVLENLPPRTVNKVVYRIQRYRPRIEGLFSRLERWTNIANAADTCWRSISKDNITTWYGKTAESRIADPAEPTRIRGLQPCAETPVVPSPSPIGWERAGVRAKHAVFLVAESEALTYHYELDLKSASVLPDPRIAHTLSLQFDEFANVLQLVAVVYTRVGQFEKDALLKKPDLDLIRQVQGERHLAYPETRYIDSLEPKLEDDVLENPDTYRLRVPCEVLTYDLSGMTPKGAKGYFALEEMRRFRLSLIHQPAFFRPSDKVRPLRSASRPPGRSKGVNAGEGATAFSNVPCGGVAQPSARLMEVAYLEQNRREYEITKHVSLAQLDPLALLQLRQMGTCIVEVPETLFDLDFTGHYLRRIKPAGLSIPCVPGPYTGVHCTLTLLKSSVRHGNTLLNGKYARQEGDPRFTDSLGAIPSIVTSNGQNDGGLFETNLRDERFLPFEGAGTLSEWQLQLPTGFRPFDYDTISDVILHLRYTARDGGAPLKQKAALERRTSINDFIRTEGQRGLAQVFKLRHDFPTEWAKFVNGTGDFTATIRKDCFPYFAGEGSENHDHRD